MYDSIDELKKLAGVNEFKGYTEYTLENISDAANSNAKKMRDKNIKPGDNKEIQITDALNIQAKQGKVIAYKFKGKRFDCGSVKGFLEATNHFANKLGI